MSARFTGSFLLITSIVNQIGAPAATPITLSGSLRRSPAGGEVNGYIKRATLDCPHCHSSSTTERAGRTVHGFRRFRCWQCGRRYNKRTGTALNRVPSDLVFLFWRPRYKLSLRDPGATHEMGRRDLSD